MDRLLRVQQHLSREADGSDVQASPLSPSLPATNPTAGVLTWLSNLFGGPSSDPPASNEAEKDIFEELIMIPTRDEGVRLSCLLCRPTGEQAVPVLLTMHYAGDHPDSAATMQPLAQKGFAVADAPTPTRKRFVYVISPLPNVLLWFYRLTFS